MKIQTRTFQLRLSRGPQEAILDEVAQHLTSCERALHVLLRKIAHKAEAEDWDETTLKEKKNALKRNFLVSHGITGRQYNSLIKGLEGRYSSLQELAKLRVQNNKVKLVALDKKIKVRAKKIENFASNSAIVKARALKGKGPTKAQAKSLMSAEQYDKNRFIQHNQKRRIENIKYRIEKDISLSKTAVPSIVFGSKKLLRQREAFHPNDKSGIDRWRHVWQSSRSAQFLCIGSRDETAGCQSCVGTIGESGKLALRLRLPPALCDMDKYVNIDNIDIPLFGSQDIIAALAAHSCNSDERRSIAWRFVKDIDWKKGNKLSAWRVFVTIDISLPDITTPVFKTSSLGKPSLYAQGISDDGVFCGALGVDLNADHLAWCAIDRNGNPLKGKSGRIKLPLTGKSSWQRRAIIGDACAKLVSMAQELRLPLVVEQLDFKKKKQNLRKEDGTNYARMLSSFAYSFILTTLRRRAERLGIELVEVNPAYTSVIGRVNYARRYGLSIHGAAACAIARRAARFTERVNYVYGYRGRRNTLPTKIESRKHVWTLWSKVIKERPLSSFTHIQWHDARDSYSITP